MVRVLDSYKKELPRESLELQSYREISLELEVDQVKNKLQQSVTEREQFLEEEIQCLKSETKSWVGNFKNL